MSKLEALLEQTSFLLDQQKEAKNESNKIFTDLLAFINQNLKKNDEESELALSLGKVYDMLSGHAQSLADEAQEDIDFLQEQLGALLELKKINDPVKAQDMLTSLIDADEEIPDTTEFKKQVAEELALSRQYLITMVEDVKGAITEGTVTDLEMLLEALSVEEEELEEAEDDANLDDEDLFEEEEEEEDGCGSCSGGGCGSGGCGGCKVGSKGKEVDIFSFISKYDQDLENDANSDKDKKKKH